MPRDILARHEWPHAARRTRRPEGTDQAGVLRGRRGDGVRKKPAMLLSDMGGIDIEEVNEQHPDRVGRTHLSNLVEAPDFRAKEVIAQTGVTAASCA